MSANRGAVAAKEVPREEMVAWRYFALRSVKKKNGEHLKQVDIAEKLGVSVQTVNKVMQGIGTSYMVSAAITIESDEDHIRLWGDTAAEPTEEHAERLAVLFNVRWCRNYPHKNRQQFSNITTCLNCKRNKGCKELSNYPEEPAL